MVRVGGGIIPARAGFTRRCWRVFAAGRDHPRSRGVYAGGRLTSLRVLGSSPLARGLRGARTASLTVRGIIPARAGFTLNGDYEQCALPDHPRSRGVYVARKIAAASGTGSSPLARGLLPNRRGDRLDPRIIPARAGFTRVWLAGDAGRWDHPRSRGVYPVGAAPQVGESGSSPLARGLQSAVAVHADDVGIIPARAGFTGGGQDLQVAAVGSSPLARGLPGGQDLTIGAGRIIPARAGFTSAGLIGQDAGTDHPRSRGVYQKTREVQERSEGSSPLARGLPRQLQTLQAIRRIIPARAGFTSAPDPSSSHPRDHPRSRGVYVHGRVHAVEDVGSSPLARGLHKVPASDRYIAGIIPARAGFTHGFPQRAGASGDHPRSRGVYPLPRPA